MKNLSKAITSFLLSALFLFGISDTTIAEAATSTTVITQATSSNITSLSDAIKSSNFYNSTIPSGATKITLGKTSVKISGKGAKVKGSDVTISSAGTYVLKGTLTNGQIIINAGSKDNVQIILNGVTITCKDSAPIFIKNADKTTISIQKGTKNTLTDTKNYVYTDKTKQEPDATLFSKDDLLINGTGTLKIIANFNNAINCRDDLKIVQSTIQINSVDDGIIGHDSVAIKDSKLTITTKGNALKSANTTSITKG